MGEIIDFRRTVNMVIVSVCIKFLRFISVGVVVNSVVTLSDAKKLFYKLSKQIVSNDGFGSSVLRYSLMKLMLQVSRVSKIIFLRLQRFVSISSIIRLINIASSVSVIESFICQVECVIIWICIGIATSSKFRDIIEMKRARNIARNVGCVFNRLRLSSQDCLFIIMFCY